MVGASHTSCPKSAYLVSYFTLTSVLAHFPHMQFIKEVKKKVAQDNTYASLQGTNL
jgi:hypothetical protein